MAMSKVTIVTPFALEGIDAEPGKDLLLAKDEESFANCIFDVLNDNLPGDIATQARKCVEDKYSWESKFKQYDSLLKSVNS